MNHKSLRMTARKAAMCGTAAILALTMMPTVAFAEVVDGKPVYKLPDKPMSVQQQKTDAAGNKYTVDVISVSKAAPPMQMPYYSLLGINNTAKGRASSAQPTSSAQNGLFGSDANQFPDAYLYNYCASLNGATVATDAMINGNSSQTVTINGTEYNMPAEIYMETTVLQTTTDKKSGNYTYAEWVALENQRENRTKTTTYDPTFVTFNLMNGGTYKLTESLYSMADTADQIITNSKDANGNYHYATRYADGANTWMTASNYEDIIKGSQYYLLSKLEDKTIAEKATVAVICGYDTETKNYAVRKLDIGNGDIDTNKYAGRIAGAVCTIANDMNTKGLEPAQDAYVGTVTQFGQETTLDENQYVVWYTAEQIVRNCDAVLITDAYEGNAQSYLAHASNGKQPTVYTNTEPLIAAQATARAEGKTAADICVNWPQTLFGCFYAQGCENVMLTFISEAFLYPQVFNLTDMMAWWAKNVWHITDASLQDMVDSTCYNVSLSTNQSKIGKISSDYKTTIDAMINAGNAYYLSNHEAIDALNEGNIKTHSLEYLQSRTITSVTLDQNKYDYTGKPVEPKVTVKAGDKVLVEGTDYTVAYANNTNPGVASVIVTGKGVYNRASITNFNIGVTTITNTMVSAIEDQTYTGSQIKPKVTVKDGDTVLVEGTDYDLTYGDNVKAGLGFVTITGKGNYTGTVNRAFNIVDPTADNVSVYRLYNKATSEHLWTTDANEYSELPKYGWTQEDVAWTSPAKSDTGVIRLYNPALGIHHYSADANEIDTLTKSHGWVKDQDGAVMFYGAGKDDKNATAVFGMYNGGLSQHLLTMDENEYKVLSGMGWDQEDVKFYAFKA